MEDGQSFCLWQDLVEDGGLVVVSPYMKYNRGLSLRDVEALFNAIGPILARVGHKKLRFCSLEALRPEEVGEQNLLLIASQVANEMTKRIVQQSQEYKFAPSLRLGKGFLQDMLRIEAPYLRPEYEEPYHDVHTTTIDYGVITRMDNPYNPEKKVIMIAGIHGYGTLAAAQAFSDESSYQEIEKILQELSFDPERDQLAEILLRAEIHEHSWGSKKLRRPDKITTETVRLNRDTHRQWTTEPSTLQWQPAPPPPLVEKKRSILMIAFRENSERALCKLQDSTTYTAFVEQLGFSSKDVERLSGRMEEIRANWRVNMQKNQLVKDGWRGSAKGLGEDVAQKMSQGLKVLRRASSFSPRSDDLQICFAGPRDYLRIPFEFIYDDEELGEPCLALKHPIYRTITGLYSKRDRLDDTFMEKLQGANQKLRILLIASDPYGNLQVDVEVRSIKQFLDQSSLKLLIEATDSVFSNKATRGEIEEILGENCPYHILHYAGHAAFDGSNPENSYLVLKDGHLKIDELAQWIDDSQIRFCYLSCCEGAATGSSSQLLKYDFLGLADGLIKVGGVPAVLGFRWPVIDNSALSLSKFFYESLFSEREFAVEKALFRARGKLARQERNNPDWISPILIMQS